uniref:Uncharacterized protein n=1 Tax=viral metagenome TaxID=1070528 RepID=A0A6C0H717_9ZZZZ
MRLSEQSQRRIPYLLGIIVILYTVKPSIVFKPNGKPRVYGVGYDEEGYKKTLYTFQFVVIIIVLLIMVFF